MRPGKTKSRTFRRVKTKVPGNKTVVHYSKRKPGKAKCARCRAKLQGVPQQRKVKLATIPKSNRRPSRPFGGNLCTRCLRKVLKEQVRSEDMK